MKSKAALILTYGGISEYINMVNKLAIVLVQQGYANEQHSNGK